MATQTLTGATLPGEAELRSFASAAAQLLIAHPLRASGARSGSRRAGVGLVHLDHRDYLPGDEVRHIDWRQTARRRQPVVRRFESESVSDWTLLLDASSSMATHGATKWQAAVSMAAAMSYALLQVGHRVGLLAFGARLLCECPRGRGRQHYTAIARQLTALRPAASGERSEPGVCTRRLQGAASVFMLSDCLADDETLRDLRAIGMHCNALHVMQLTDAADSQLDIEGEVELVDVETGATMAARAGAQANALAAAERAAMTDRLRRFCAGSAAAFTEADIGQPWQHTLLRHLARSPC